jgi:formate dehydrogenase major subunit
MASAHNNGGGGLGGFVRSHVGCVPNPLSRRSKTLTSRISDAQVAMSVCPYCGVGCSQRIYYRDGKIIDIEGTATVPSMAATSAPKAPRPG